MKTYSLHPDFFGFFCETCETLDYLDSEFPGLLDEKAIDSYLSSRINGTSTLKLSVIQAFREPYMETMNSMKKSMPRGSMQPHVAINADDIDEERIIISEAIGCNLIVLNHYVSLSSDEIHWLKFLVRSGYASDSCDSSVLSSLKNKLDGAE